MSKLDDYIVASSSDGIGYEVSGFLIIKENNLYKMANYSHCSCYDTWESLGGDYYDNDISSLDWDWTGTKEELLEMVRNEYDPVIHERKMSPEDYDYKLKMDCYKQILELESRGCL